MPETPALPRAPWLSARAVGIGAAVITVAMWTAFIIIARASAARSLTPLDLAAARIVGAALVLLPWGWWLVRQARATGAASGPIQGSSFFGLSPMSLRLTALAGVFGAVLYAVFSYTGFFYAPAAHASVLMPGSLPLWTALLAALVLRDRITPVRALGLVLIVAGDLLVGGRSLLHAFSGSETWGPALAAAQTSLPPEGAPVALAPPGSGVWKGDLLFMAAAFCWACYAIVVRRHGLDAVRATIAITVFAMFSFVPVYALLVGLGVLNSQLTSAPVGEVLFQMLFQGVGSVVISGITFTQMVRHFGPVRSTMITALVPGLSALGAVFFLGEPLHVNLLLGLALVTAGILFGVRAIAAPKPPSAERCHA
ncbi:MAG: DMT family transporter [Comamonadaceae bacterium]|nr:MAG: DMT family transporter [Comamonadaceae bacterium]